MIVQKSLEASEDDEPFMTVMSKVERNKKQTNPNSDDELTNSDNSVG